MSWAHDLLSRRIVAPQSNNTLITYSSSLFFKIILIICCYLFIGLGSCGKLGFAAGSESLAIKTRDDTGVCRLCLISKILALGSSAHGHFTLHINPCLAGASLSDVKNPSPCP
jgi:hypothetical protein